MIVYKIYDSLSRTYKKKEYKSLLSARKEADRLDMLYGAYRFHAQRKVKTI
jgi:hypothetical protein